MVRAEDQKRNGAEERGGEAGEWTECACMAAGQWGGGFCKKGSEGLDSKSFRVIDLFCLEGMSTIGVDTRLPVFFANRQG